MSRTLNIFLLMMVAILWGEPAISQAQSPSLLTQHVREVTLNGQAPLVGHLPATQSMRLVLVLPHRNQAELDAFLKELYDPSSTSYRKFLTVEEFTARFGPSQEDYDSVIRFAEANGFSVVGKSRNRMNLDVTGSAANIENAFHLSMGVYQHPTENRTFFAPDREPTPSLAIPLWHITGLDNYSTPKAALVRRDASASVAEPAATTGSGPGQSFLGSDMRAAYYVNGDNSATLTGAGQSVGLLEFTGTDLADLTTYFKNAGQTNNVPITLLSVDSQSATCTFAGPPACDDTQPTLDMTQVLGMAPGLSSLVMYIGNGGLAGQTIDDTAIFNAMATASPLNAQLSSSWQWKPSDPTTDDVYFQEFAAQGQTLFVDAGDTGPWSPTVGFYWPSDSVYVTAVGGTDLTTTGAGGQWASETGWADTGGGVSPDEFPIPSWQVATATGCASCSQIYRNGPDVSANADFTFYSCADQVACSENLYGGTAFATPMWAGYLALANEQTALNGNPVLGFINPALYAIGLGPSPGVYFHDIISGGNNFGATVGYDLSTGWGSPNGRALIDALAGTPVPVATLSATSLSFNGQPIGTTSAAQQINVTNTGTLVLSVNTVSLKGANVPSFGTMNTCGSPLAPGGHCTISVTFKAPGTGIKTASLIISSTAINSSLTVALSGTGITPTSGLSINPQSVAFGSQEVGLASSAQTLTVANTTVSNVTIKTVSLGGANAPSFGLNNTCGSLLSPGAQCTIGVSFAPTAAGAKSASVVMVSTAASPTNNVALSGSGYNPTAGLTVSPASLSFGNEEITVTSAAQLISVTNTTAATVSIKTVSLSGANTPSFSASNTCGTPLPVEGSCTVSVDFDPAGIGSKAANVSIASAAKVSLASVSLTGTGVAPTKLVTVSPTSVNFGNQPVGSFYYSTQFLLVTNSTGATVTIITETVSGINAPSFSTSDNCLTVLAVGASCTIGVTFVPAGIGAKSAQVNILSSNGSSPAAITLSGTGVAATAGLTLSPSSLSFGNQPDGTTSAAQLVNVTNTTAAPVTVNTVSLTGANPASFASTNTCGAPLAVEASCTISVSFTPRSTGAKSASLSIASSAASTAAQVPLTGTGT